MQDFTVDWLSQHTCVLSMENQEICNTPLETPHREVLSAAKAESNASVRTYLDGPLLKNHLRMSDQIYVRTSRVLTNAKMFVLSCRRPNMSTISGRELRDRVTLAQRQTHISSCP